ncbi:M20 family metallopeptidase [Chloroflexales bacterium ZM16-3]|nr:M20 family metallopeptidase [Chloroflexales bacterium ZM16-3]
MTTDLANSLISWMQPCLDTYLEELRQLCAIECPSSHKLGVDEAGAWVRGWVAARGWELSDYPDERAGDGLVATVRGTGTLRAMLVAHLDTVYPVGVAAERPLRREGNTLLGPGSADNKSGLLSGLYAAAALAELAPDSFATLSVVCGGDEETDSRASAAMLDALAPDYDIALVLEAGRENGDIVSARKGGGMFSLEVTGRAAHAGVEPEKGSSAVLAMAHQIIALQALNGMRSGATVNVGVISGGSVPNAVPDSASALIDVRVTRPEDMAPVEEAIRAIASEERVPGTHTSVGGSWGFPPMARTPQILRLAEVAKGCAEELGFRISDAATGGVSYANLLAGLGLPVLDGLGPVGGLDHSPREYIDIDSIVPRTALLAMIVARAGEM